MWVQIFDVGRQKPKKQAAHTFGQRYIAEGLIGPLSLKDTTY